MNSTTKANAPKFHYQQGREVYAVDADGCVSRPAIDMAASGQWRITGAVRFNNFGYVVERVPFPRCFTQTREWRYKNGKGRWFLEDIDHGTARIMITPILWVASDAFAHDAKDMILQFARDCALDVLDKWDAPEVVKEFLEIGNPELAKAAANAAADAAKE